jgi:hypothetical protein
MAQWERLAPYNAAQSMTLAGAFPRDRVEVAWREALASLGLSVHVSPVAETDDVLKAINDGLNAAIDRSLFGALRPTLHVQDDTTLILLYRHLFADSASIRLIMRQWYALLTGDATLRVDRPVTMMRAERSLAGTIVRHPLAIARAASREFVRWREMKQVARMRTSNLDLRAPVVYERRDLPRGLIAKLLDAARQRNAKVNDLFVAAGAVACAEHLPMERTSKRPDVAFGTIVDTRTQSPLDAFGLSLGFLQTIFPDDALHDIERTITIAREQSARAKISGDAASSALRLSFAERYCRKHSPIEMAEFYRKRCPLVGGVSNVDLARDWPGKVDSGVLLDYARISPLGPMLSVVFTPTTLGDRLHYGFTWRTGLVDAMTARAIAERFEVILESLI